MTLWQRLLLTIVSMIAASFIAGLAWSSYFNSGFPGYLGGLIGGLTAVPVWELLKRIDSKKNKAG